MVDKEITKYVNKILESFVSSGFSDDSINEIEISDKISMRFNYFQIIQEFDIYMIGSATYSENVKKYMRKNLEQVKHEIQVFLNVEGEKKLYCSIDNTFSFGSIFGMNKEIELNNNFSKDFFKESLETVFREINNNDSKIKDFLKECDKTNPKILNKSAKISAEEQSILKNLSSGSKPDKKAQKKKNTIKTP